jgi:hypothetical protein
MRSAGDETTRFVGHDNAESFKTRIAIGARILDQPLEFEGSFQRCRIVEEKAAPTIEPRRSLHDKWASSLGSPRPARSWLRRLRQPSLIKENASILQRLIPMPYWFGETHTLV